MSNNIYSRTCMRVTSHPGVINFSSACRTGAHITRARAGVVDPDIVPDFTIPVCAHCSPVCARCNGPLYPSWVRIGNDLVCGHCISERR